MLAPDLSLADTATSMSGRNRITLQSGNGYAGSVLTATRAGQWLANGTPTAGATAPTLAITPESEGAAFSCDGSAPLQFWTPDRATPLLGYRSDLSAKLTLTSTAVSSFESSPPGYALSQTSATARPLTGRAINTRPALDFDGGDSLTRSGAAGLPALAMGDSLMAAVIHWDAIPAFEANLLRFGYQGYDRIGLTYRAGALAYLHSGAAEASHSVGAAAAFSTLGTSLVVGARIDATALLRVNGVQLASGSASNAGAVDGLRMGYNLDGAIGETWVFASASVSLIERIEGYLAHKYALTLPSGHKYQNAAPLVV